MSYNSALQSNNTELKEILQTVNELPDARSGSSYTIPDYWKTAVDNVVSKVKTLQDAGGINTVNFLLFSDLHYSDNNAKIKHLGHLCAAIMDKCYIPLVINCGDTMSSSPLVSESELLENLDNGTALLSPIPMEGYAQILGNHDDVWGQYYNGTAMISYVNKVAPEKMWNRVFRKQTKDLRRVFGGNGTYFYVDNVVQKVRFVCLNSHYYDGEEITNGTTKMMTVGFGIEQLDWLKNTALNVEDGWSVAIATHVPPTAKNINGHTDYLSQISDGEAFRTIIKETTAKLIGIFCGHCHASAIVTDDLPCPIVTVTTAGGSPYDSTEGTRTAGTTTETALDVVSINKAAEKIYLTRLGIGTDRVCSYAGVEIVTYHITNTLTNVTNGNTLSVIESGQPYSATLTALDGYDLSTVTVKMGRVDITSTAYSNGVITIAEVTGDVVIIALAEKSAEPVVNIWQTPYKLNSRLNTSETDPGADGVFISAWYPVSQEQLGGDIVLRSNKNIFNHANLSGSGDYLRFYSSTTAGTALLSDTFGQSSTFTKAYDSENGIYSLTIKHTWFGAKASEIKYFRWCAKVSTSAITADYFNGCILTINQEIA